MTAATVRPAQPADAPAMSAVLIASITQLCTADHQDNPDAIEAWTRNKSPEAVARGLASPNLRFFVAEVDGVVAAVGALNTPSEVGLNYVDPAFRLRGVSRALLTALEREMAAQGTTEASLKSTATARQFYLSAGWVTAGPPVPGRFITAYPMRKTLSPVHPRG